jgi:hypothetical protein
MTTLPPIIHVVDDDASFRAALDDALAPSRAPVRAPRRYLTAPRSTFAVCVSSRNSCTIYEYAPCRTNALQQRHSHISIRVGALDRPRGQSVR